MPKIIVAGVIPHLYNVRAKLKEHLKNASTVSGGFFDDDPYDGFDSWEEAMDFYRRLGYFSGSEDEEDAEAYWEKRRKEKEKEDDDQRLVYGYSDSPADDLPFWDDEEDAGFKRIYFYPDYRNQDEREEFKSLKEFKDYCTDNGYHICSYEMNNLIYRTESYCCLERNDCGIERSEVATFDSYGDLFYEVCDEEELEDIYGNGEFSYDRKGGSDSYYEEKPY